MYDPEARNLKIMAAFLSIRDGSGWLDLPIQGARFRIGRDQSNDYALETAHISRNHCEIYNQGNAWFVRDLGSKLGTRLNGVAITESPLSDGDTLTFGNKVEARFKLGPDQSIEPTVFVGLPKAQANASGMRLMALNGPIANQVFPVVEDITRLGRHASCEVCVPQDTVSQFHAELIRTPEGMVLADLNSSNGTYINDRRIHRQTLQPGDKLRLDWIAFRFEDKNYSVSKMGTRIRGDLLKELTVDGDDRDSQQYPAWDENQEYADKVLVRGLQAPVATSAKEKSSKRGLALWLTFGLVVLVGAVFWSWVAWGDSILEFIKNLRP